VSGSWFTPPRSPWPAPFPPPSPPIPWGDLCSKASSVLWSCPTPYTRASRPYPAGVCRADLAVRAQARGRASRVPYTMFPCMPGVCDPARCGYILPWRCSHCGLPRVRSASAPRSGPISGLNTLPARSPVNASRTPLPKLAHDSGPAWLARPSLSETCTLSHRAGLSRHTRTLGLHLTAASVRSCLAAAARRG
jgi:hypothetical protein